MVGAPPLQDERLALLVRSVVDTYAPLEVWLFGSRAEGRARPDSDYDLLVVVDDATPDFSFDLGRMPRHGIPVDVVPYRREYFLDEIDVVDTLPYAAYQRGMKVYDSAWSREADSRISR